MQCSYRYLIGQSERLAFFKSHKRFTTIQAAPSLDSAAYTHLLQSSTDTHSLIQGKSIHAHMIKSSFKPCIFLQNNLLNLYSKCGDVATARRLFDTMPDKDIVSWNSLVAGYLQMGHCDEAMGVFVEARNAEGTLDKFTYASVLSVCARNGDLRKGRMIHGMVMATGLYKHVFLTNTLIDMYSKCSEIHEARRVFDSSDELDDVSWNSLITAYVRVGLANETLRTFAWMHCAGGKMNSFALGSVLKSCSALKDSKELGKMIHGCVVKVGLVLDVIIGGALLDMYAKNGLLSEAIKVFKLLPNPNVVVFNAMIAGFGRSEIEIHDDLTCEALRLFQEMQRRGLKPTKFTFSSVLRVCNLTEAFEFGKQIHGHIFKSELQDDQFVGSALIDLYSNSGSIEDGLKCFRSLPNQDIVTWTSMISGFVQNEHFEGALSLFYELLNNGRKPDQFTISCVMSSCANLAAARSGELIQSYATKAGFRGFTIYSNSQIFMYAKVGDVDAADQTFQEMENRDIVSWSAMILSHAQHGCARDALKLFKEMEQKKVVPNHITFLGILTACSHGGLVDEGFRYFEIMKGDYGIVPNVKHCACVVDLLGRAGRLTDAENFIMESGFDNDPVIWRTLLAACRVHGDSERGTRVAERIMELEPGASSSYVLLYNMYLDVGSQSLAIKTRDLMKHQGVKKEPGLSWIEIGAAVHSFVVGDKSHPQSHAIYAKLEDLLLKIDKMDHADSGPQEFGVFKSELKGKLMNCHSEKLAVALGIICLPAVAPIRVMKNLRVCVDCHTTMKLFSKIERREIVLRDPIRFHRFRGGLCSCGDYW